MLRIRSTRLMDLNLDASRAGATSVIFLLFFISIAEPLCLPILASEPLRDDTRRDSPLRRRSAQEERLYSDWEIDNPSKHEIALREATRLEYLSEKLELDGSRLVTTPDFKSRLDSTVTDHSHFRSKGAAMVGQSRENRTAAATIRKLVEERVRELRRLSNTPLTPSIEFKNSRGSGLKASVILFSGPDAVVRREDGRFFQISMQDIGPSYAPLFDMIRVAEFGRRAAEIAYYEKDGISGSLIFSDAQILWVRTATGEVEQLPNVEKRDLQRELVGQLERANLEKKAAEIAAGTMLRFVVNRILSFNDFPDLQLLGGSLYQVTVGPSRALLVTSHKMYVSSRRSEMRVRHFCDSKIVMTSGATETVPVMVEVELSAVSRYDKSVKTRVASENLLKEHDKNRQLYSDLILVRVGDGSYGAK